MNMSNDSHDSIDSIDSRDSSSDGDTVLDAYLRRFTNRRQVTLIGPVLNRAPRAGRLREPLVWVDGGADHRGPIFRDRPGIAVGDGDSAKSRLDQYLPKEKDYSDLAFVLRRIPRQFAEVVLLGFLGGRRDHELFNFGEAHHFLAARETPTRLRFEHNVRAYSKGEWQLHNHNAFSLAVFAPATVTLTGPCKYPIDAPTEIAPLSSFGLSNRSQGELTLRTDAPVFIFEREREIAHGYSGDGDAGGGSHGDGGRGYGGGGGDGGGSHGGGYSGGGWRGGGSHLRRPRR
ncbi:MAG: hypothetical protein OXU62_04470 [Gammaproteobacteria bacterium]|nr:hypothetical protein [Gammaproteobacteria bacterium]